MPYAGPVRAWEKLTFPDTIEYNLYTYAGGTVFSTAEKNSGLKEVCLR